MPFSLQQQHLALLPGGQGAGCAHWRGFQLGIQNFRGWLGSGEEDRGTEGHSLGIRDFRTAGELPAIPLIARPLMVPFSSLQKCSSAQWSSLVFTLIPEVTSLLLHPSSLFQSWPSIYLLPSVSFVSHHPAAGCALPFAPRLVTPLCPSPSLSPDQNFPSVSLFLCASSLNPCLHTQSLYICVFTLSNLSPLTTFVLLGPTPSSFLAVTQWHSSDSFSHACKSLLLAPASQHKVCPGHWQLLSHLTPVFSVPSLHY